MVDTLGGWDPLSVNHLSVSAKRSQWNKIWNKISGIKIGRMKIVADPQTSGDGDHPKFQFKKVTAK